MHVRHAKWPKCTSEPDASVCGEGSYWSKMFQAWLLAQDAPEAWLDVNSRPWLPEGSVA